MRVLLTGNDTGRLVDDLQALGLEVADSEQAADFVISYGGDGSFLGADRRYPDLPKLTIRRDADYEKCGEHGTRDVLRRILHGQQDITRLPRVTAIVGSRQIWGINDIVFHNALVPSAVRYRVRINGEPYSEEIVGDGLIVATPFGSSAYYRSITNSVFRVGMGLAFNNSTESITHLVLHPSAVIHVELTRGPGVVFADNMPDPLSVEGGDHIEFRLSSHEAEIYEISTLLCRRCREKATGKAAGFRHV